MAVKFDDRAFRAGLTSRIATALDGEGSKMVDHAKGLVGRQNAGAPSQPGEPPRRVSGRLERSLGHAVEVDADSVTLTVGSGDPKAKLLEVGTSKMAARPFLRPTLKASVSRLRAAVRDSVFGRRS